MEGHDGTLGSIVGVAQADGRSGWQPSSPAHGGSQERVLAAVATQGLRHLIGRAELLREADRHVLVNPALDKAGLGPRVCLVADGRSCKFLNTGIVALDPEAAFEEFSLGLGGFYRRHDWSNRANTQLEAATVELLNLLPLVQHERGG